MHMGRVITMQEKSKMAEDNNDERNDNVPSPGPKSHSEYMSESVGHLGVLNIALRSKRQVNTCQPDGGSSDDLEDRNWNTELEKIVRTLTVLKVYKAWQLIWL
jgi:hypothetical protein